jgi:formylglycine-generating enzyme required for sulfatase activity
VRLLNPADESITTLASGFYPTWSSDGSQLFYYDVEGTTLMSVSVFDTDATPTTVFRDIPNPFEAAVSPDASKVAVFRQGEVHIDDVKTGETIASHRTDGWWEKVRFGWSPDSRSVGFSSASGTKTGLWILDVPSGESFKVIAEHAILPSWSTNGRHMLYIDHFKREIHLVGWSREIQQRLVDASSQLKRARTLLSERLATERQWRVNSIGLNMLRVPAGTVQRAGGGQNIEVAREFLLSDREISDGMFRQFIDDPNYPASEKPVGWKASSSSRESPAQFISWYDAVMFCNWLSRKEGREVCYTRVDGREKDPRQFDSRRLRVVEQQIAAIKTDTVEKRELLHQKNVLLFQLGRYKESLAGFNVLQSRGPHVHRYLAILLAHEGKVDAARESLDLFVEATRKGYVTDDQMADWATNLWRSYLSMIVESWLGNGQAALERLQKDLDRSSDTFLYNAACACSLSSVGAAHHMQSVLEAELKSIAIGLLRAAVSRGTRLNTLRNDPDLDPLRQEAAFLTLLNSGSEEEENWLVNVASDGYRLPTNTEWEYACRAGTRTWFSFGDDANWLDRYGIYKAEYPGVSASKFPNLWGFFDMHGNVTEWCQDENAKDKRNCWGGNWAGPASQCVSASTSTNAPAIRSPTVGFRVALVPSSQSSEAGAESGSGQSEGVEAEPEPLD